MPKRNRGDSNTKKSEIKFELRLVLANWMLDQFNASSFEELARHLRDPLDEGFEEDGFTRFLQCIRKLCTSLKFRKDQLLSYDENIVRHWKVITEKRNDEKQNLYPKYFQYLCLLFTEVYLDHYFRDLEGLRAELNVYTELFNTGDAPQQTAYKMLLNGSLPEDIKIEPYQTEDLRKLAFWSATGSGKTLMMHINILQYKHYLKKYSDEKSLNRIILLTPNEGLSFQHRDEFVLSDMDAEIFDKDAGTLFTGQEIEIIDIHKLKETAGEKTIAVEAFEGNNLVLVDEGHRGTSGTEVGHWMKMRNKLCEKGFSFEYSATFGQAVKASGNKELAPEYAKCILFDYSYKYFYKDGYGKEYRILNLKDDWSDEHRVRYLTAGLLAFYQQQKLFMDKFHEFRLFMIEKPLWIFVGGSVTKTPSKRDVSDVMDILLFLGQFVKNRNESIRSIEMLISGRSNLNDAQGRDIFSNAFTYLGQTGFNAEAIFNDILITIFHSNNPGLVHIKRLKGAAEVEGEIALHIGEENNPFGVINVGDPSGLCSLCEDHPEYLTVSDSQFSASLFRHVNKPDSKINILIGSKKFSEGWSSWRVSTMGLMNIGKNEGSQIIQLFGRGVRLKGLDFCLKRSTHIVGAKPPKGIERLETLNVFGIHADYMQQFKEYLEDEGLPANDESIEFILPVIKNLGKQPLKTIRVKEGIDFKRQGPKPALALPDEKIIKNKIIVDWYPKIQALTSKNSPRSDDMRLPDEWHFEEDHLAFLDYDELYFSLQQQKKEKAWYNFNIYRENIHILLKDHRWYVVYIPSTEIELRSFEKIRLLNDIAEILLRKYCEKLYVTRKAEFEQGHLEYRDLKEDDPNFIENYTLLIRQSREDIIAKLQEIKEILERGELRNIIEFQGLTAIMFDRHLYQPLLYVNSDLIEIKPVALNEGERDFVLDLQQFCGNNKKYFEDKELYLLRNMSRGRGMGFFEAGNFYPDFIMWLFANGKQYINFIDPKGLRNLRGLDDKKIAFYQDIKTIENRLKEQDPKITLNSFIISNTPYSEISWWKEGLTKDQCEERNIFFQRDDKSDYIEKIIFRSSH